MGAALLLALLQAVGAAPAETTAPPGAGAAPKVTPAEAGRWQRLEHANLVVWLPARVYDGTLLVVELEPASCSKPALRWLGHAFRPYPAGDRLQALLPVPLGRATEQTLEVACGARRARFAVAVTERSYPEARLSVDPKFSRRPPRRAAAESARIKKALRHQSEGRAWSAAFVRPVDTVVTSAFGVRRTFNDRIASRHQGVDLDGQIGLPVTAANDGLVVLAADDYYFTGSALFVDHGDELFSMYFHLSQLLVRDGERVRRGQVIGAVGRSGRVTGPHLHFGMKLAGVYVDPEELLCFQPGVALSAPSVTGPP